MLPPIPEWESTIVTIADLKNEAEAHVRYEKGTASKLARVTFSRIDKHNTATIDMRAFSEMLLPVGR